MQLLHHSSSSLLQSIETRIFGLVLRLAPLKQIRRLLSRQDRKPERSRHQQQLSSLDDQILDDLGLQRSEVRAVEYGIIPRAQALDHKDQALDPSIDELTRKRSDQRT
ncbi:MAG: DUF1127 domain-containing protein [Geminicoccaceae bacterium]